MPRSRYSAIVVRRAWEVLHERMPHVPSFAAHRRSGSRGGQRVRTDPGTRLVSNSFDMGDWQPDETATVPSCTQFCRAMLWIVPAKTAGTWRLLPAADLTLTQSYQMLSGTFASAGAGSSMPIANA